jgi:hypothetical protein
MFINAIEINSKYTRPIHTITKQYSSNDVIPGAATIFFINDEGYALTCKHVIELLAQSEPINKNYEAFKLEKNKLPKNGKLKRNIKALKLKYKISDNSTVQLQNTFIDCADTMTNIKWFVHPDYDLAIIKFEGFKKLNCKDFPVFKKDSSEIKAGKYLCRLGYPFPEFTNFDYDKQNDTIIWTKTGVNASPRFPIEGMVTRFLANSGKKFGIELSTPGLRGQSGGPLFDTDGIVCGMQSRTKHLHLGFDIENTEILSKGKKKKVDNYSFIHLGECIDVDVIKDFLKLHNVSFNEK